MPVKIEHIFPECECGHSYIDHDEDLVCEMSFLDACYGYWPHGLQVSRSEMLQRWS